MNATRALPLLAASLLILPASAQDPPKPEPPRWPKLDRNAGAQLNKCLLELRKLPAEDEEGFDAIVATVRDLGPGCGPRLLQELGRTDEEDQRAVERWRTLLDAAVTPAEAPVIATELGSSNAEVRLWCAQRLFADATPELLPAVRKQALREKDYFAGSWLTLARVHLGDAEALEPLEALMRKEWARWREPAHEALAGLRGKTLTERALAYLRSTSEPDRLLGLRLLAGGGEASAAQSLKGYLDAESRTVREATVNALRAMVDHHPPIHDLPVFELIEKVEEWKRRLGAG